MSKKARSRSYVLCISNRGFRVSLVVRKVYVTLPDASGESRGLLRVVDESGAGYLYPECLFIPIDVPRTASRAFRLAS